MTPYPCSGIVTRTASRLRALACAISLSGLLAVTGCALPDKPTRPSIYDFGSGAVAPTGAPNPLLAPVALAEIEASDALDSTAVLYRLEYADAQQPRPYAFARWSMAPALLLQQRLRERLAEQRTVLTPTQAGVLGAGAAAPPWVLRLELEEFSQLFASPQQSVGLVRLRATVTQATAQGTRLLGQRNLVVQRPAAQADAAGGVRALTAASDAAIEELVQWLEALRP